MCGLTRSSTGISIRPSRWRPFTAARNSLLSLLRRVDPERRLHHGLHAERGKETIGHLVQLYAGHDINHLKQIEGMLQL